MAETFGKRMWKAMETPQGYAFISDDICHMPDKEAYWIAVMALGWQREGVKRLAALVRSYERANRAPSSEETSDAE